MDASTIASSILTSVVTAIVVAGIGILTALKQFKRQRGFERRLDWYEKTADALFEFAALNERVVYALQNHRDDLLEEESKNTIATLKTFIRTMNNSILYSDRGMYLRLKEINASLRAITAATTDRHQTGGDSTELYEANVKLLEQTLFELAKPIRKMLGLNRLKWKDFDK